MTPDTICRVFLRNLESLRLELRAYPGEESVWVLPAGVSNSGGTLTLHLAGNLQHFIGVVLGGTAYQRDREREFSARGLPRAELEAEIDAAAGAVRLGFSRLRPEDAHREFPLEIAGLHLPIETVLLQMLSHFAYHLGQIDLHRRVVTGSSESVEVLALRPLAE